MIPTIRKLLVATALAAFAAGPALAARTDVTLGVRLEPPGLDPTAGAAAAIDEVVYANIFEGLTRIGPDGSVEPALASAWDISDDGLTYTFKLHSGVKFHDGTTFDAEDVKFSLDRARADDSTNAQKALFEPIDKVEVVDPTTVKVTLKRPTGGFLFNMGWGDAVIVAPESAPNNATDPIGTGPFKFSKWNKGDSIEIVKNPDYWGEPAKLDKATFKIIADPSAAFAAMMAGDVDGFPIFPAPENLPQFEADPRFTVVVGTTEGETILAMNNKKPPLDDVLVRRAISHAIDRRAIIDGAMFGYGTPIGTHFAPHNPAYLDLTEMSAYDPEQAKALLKEAGHENGFKLSLKLPPPTYARRGGEIIAAQLREVGIEAEISNLEWAQWLEQVFKGKDFDLTIVSHTEPADINIYARPDYYFQYDSQEFRDAYSRALTAPNEQEKAEWFGKCQEIIAEDAVNGFLFSASGLPVMKADVMGWWEDYPTVALDCTEVWWRR